MAETITIPSFLRINLNQTPEADGRFALCPYSCCPPRPSPPTLVFRNFQGGRAGGTSIMVLGHWLSPIHSEMPTAWFLQACWLLHLLMVISADLGNLSSPRSLRPPGSTLWGLTVSPGLFPAEELVRLPCSQDGGLRTPSWTETHRSSFLYYL